jgi:hypothetical protein
MRPGVQRSRFLAPLLFLQAPIGQGDRWWYHSHGTYSVCVVHHHICPARQATNQAINFDPPRVNMRLAHPRRLWAAKQCDKHTDGTKDLDDRRKSP